LDSREDTEHRAGLPTVSDILEWAAAMLTARAWQSMGLVVDPATGELARDLTEARAAIDALEAIARCVPAPRSRELEVLLADLRLNYVRQAQAEG